MSDAGDSVPPGDADAPKREYTPPVWEAVDEARMRQMLEHLPDYVVMVDRDLRYQWYNRLDQTLRPEDIIGRRVHDFVADEYIPLIEQRVQEAFDTGRPTSYEVRGYAEGAITSWYSTTVVALPADDPADERALLLSTDITPRRRAEEALRASEQRFRLLTEGSPDLIIILDAAHRMTYINRAPLADQGISADSILGRDPADFIVDEHQPRLRAALEHCGETGEPATAEIRGRFSGRPFSARVLPIEGADQDASTLLVMTDVSEARREAEQRARLETQLLRAQRLETVGRLAGGVAHDFNNLLVVILSHLEFARATAKKAELPLEDFDAIGEAATRAAEMTRRLLTIGRKEAPRRDHVDLVALATDALKLLERTVPSRIEVSVETPDRPAVGFVDRSQIEQALLNLCLNARDAISGEGRVRISFRHDGEAGRVGLTVADDGSGMPEDVVAHIFEPFFTTKDAGSGTGLGLSIVHGIVAQHEGELDVESKPGQGSSFTLWLPTEASERNAGVPRAEGRAGAGERATVLVAEDDANVRSIVERVLQGAGHAVLMAADGAEAVALFEAHRGEIGAVLLDAVMPELNGHDAFLQIRAIESCVPVAFCSGFSTEVLPSGFLQRHGLVVLDKPFSPSALLATVETLLGHHRQIPPPG